VGGESGVTQIKGAKEKNGTEKQKREKERGLVVGEGTKLFNYPGRIPMVIKADKK